MPTLFERIIAGELPATILHREDRVTAFRDIHPRAPTHILIVPNKPIPTANDIADSDEAPSRDIFLSSFCSLQRNQNREEIRRGSCSKPMGLGLHGNRSAWN